MMNLDGILGHERVKKSLISLVSNSDMPHAILFSGQRGVGKRLLADRFVNSLICSGEVTPCGICDRCRQIAAGTYPDLMILERDEKGKIPVGSRDKSLPGTVRWLIDKLSKAPSSGHYSVIIDGVDTISEAGQNALLKTIEEPYSRSYIVLIADSRSGILPTIISRCVEIAFQPLSESDIISILTSKDRITPRSSFITLISGGSADIALALHDEKVFDEIISLAAAISGFLCSGNKDLFRFSELKTVSDNELLLDALVNLYGLVARGAGNGLVPEKVVIDHENAVKVVRILLALKRGLGNNFNVRNMLKGLLYSSDQVDSIGFPEADFTWLK